MLDRQESDHGYGALATAVARGDEATAKKVLSMGADARSEDHEGHTPMSMAAVSGKVSMVKLLREHGVDAGARGRDGFTALQRATWGETEAHAEVVRYLVRECGMDVDETDAMGDERDVQGGGSRECVHAEDIVRARGGSKLCEQARRLVARHGGS